MGVFLDGRGFSSTEIGEVFALMTLARIAGPNIWASIVNKTGQPLRCLQLGALLTFSSFCLAFFIYGYWGLTITFAMMMMFWTAILPQIEVLTLDCVAGHANKYGKIRLWGSIGYILLTVFTGKMLDVYSSEVILIIGAFVLMSLVFSTLFLTYPAKHKSELRSSTSIWQKIHHPAFYGFLIAAVCLQISFGPYYGFFALYTLDLGYSGVTTGWLIGLGVIAEVLIFLRAGKLIEKVGVKWILTLTMLLTALRWYLLAVFAHIPWVLFASQTLHAFSYGMAHAGSMVFIRQYFSAHQQGQGQALYTSIGFGVGGAIGSYLTGGLWQQGQGAELSFLVAAGFSLLGMCALLLVPSKRM